MSKRCVIGVVLAVLASGFAVAGDLTPPGAPAPTMKPLDQVEPRAAITDVPIVIAESGSYYVTRNLALATLDTDGITIEANNVTLDLCGFALTGPGKAAGTTGSGILVMSGVKNVTICNGTVSGWREDGIGGYVSSYATTPSNMLVENLRCSDNGTCGLRVDSVSVVRRNTCQGNGDFGIKTGSGCTIEGNSACLNTGGGIYVGLGSTVCGNAANQNTACGIYGSAESSFVDNACRNNGATGLVCGTAAVAKNNSCSENTGSGIEGGEGCVITNNSCYYNHEMGIWASYSVVSGNACVKNVMDGIRVSDRSRVVDNDCSSNGNTGDGAGINATGGDNCIENNLAAYNDRGVDCNPSTGNYIASNRASGNTTNFDIAGSNTQGSGDLANVAF